MEFFVQNKTIQSSLYDLAQPDPASLVESLRAFGYNLQTAIADLIDNSVAAKAKHIWIHFQWAGTDSQIIIEDDGEGMTEEELAAAMRLGSQSPLDERSPKDLGRFGLGLKTASFSQCRCFTVISKSIKGNLAMRRWDLDYVHQTKEWRLLKEIDLKSLQLKGKNMQNHGTIVLWQKMDRVTGYVRSNDVKAYKRFLEIAEKTKRHLEMVFHRYLEPSNGLTIHINDHPIKPWDPFLRGEMATQELPIEKLICNGKEFTVLAYILPHQSKISRDLYLHAAGSRGWNAQQGFYVYRNERLLIGGDWLDLGFQKEEHYKLARIQIDLPNCMDGEWQIDVKKSRAKLPGYLKSDLKRIATLARERAVDIYRLRGKVMARQNAQNFVFLWEQKTRHGKFFYSINRDHPLIKQVYGLTNRFDLEALLSMLEETIPVTHILVTNNGESEKFTTPYEYAPPEILKNVLSSSYKALLNTGVVAEEAKRRLLSMDPFNLFPSFLGQYLDNLAQEKQ